MKNKKTAVNNTTYLVDDVLGQGNFFAARCQTKTTQELHAPGVLQYCYVACFAKNKHELLEAMRKRLRDDCDIDMYDENFTSWFDVAATYVGRKNTKYVKQIRENLMAVLMNMHEQKQVASTKY